jgi:hypothetical protein
MTLLAAKDEVEWLRNNEAAISGTIDCAKIIEEAHNQLNRFYREEVFLPRKTIRAMDLHGGHLNLKGFEVVRTLVTDGEKYVRCILPSSASLKREQKKVNKEAQKQIPFKKISGIDGIEFDNEPMFRFIIESHRLGSIAEVDSIEVGGTADGADLHNKQSHLMCGIKLIDKCT